MNDWPEPERPIIPRPRPSRREYLAARFWDVLAAFDRWLYWTVGKGRRR